MTPDPTCLADDASLARPPVTELWIAPWPLTPGEREADRLDVLQCDEAAYRAARLQRQP